MQLYNTRNRAEICDFETAVLRGLAPGNGLYMPMDFPGLPDSFFESLPDLSFPEMAFQVLDPLIGEEVPAARLRKLCKEAFDFSVPLVELDKHTAVLELFHGPSLAFKDFGARFMARIMGYFLEKAPRPLHILVATSGDTGGAVAMGFHHVPGIQVSILFPKGRVSDLQEAQLTRLGGNVKAYEIEGSFDDCQRMVKEAFQDTELTRRHGLTSANSINIARLLPQSLHYFHAWALVQKKYPGRKLVFSVPSGNFGNVCAGAFAWKMGLPVERFIAAVNANRIFSDFLATDKFEPKESQATLSNAMDVGNPSNFPRIQELLGASAAEVGSLFSSTSISDTETEQAELEMLQAFGYAGEPHLAVGYAAWKQFQSSFSEDTIGVILGTAHPAKFIPALPQELKSRVEIPDALSRLLAFPSQKITLPPQLEALAHHLNLACTP
jgi:threonine synthase